MDCVVHPFHNSNHTDLQRAMSDCASDDDCWGLSTKPRLESWPDGELARICSEAPYKAAHYLCIYEKNYALGNYF